MNKQEIFDTVLLALRKQGKASVGPRTRGSGEDYQTSIECCYRGPDGAKCAAGHLIPDADYRIEMEGKNIYGMLELLPITSPARQIFNPTNISFLSSLQILHDDFLWKEGLSVWESKMKDFATREQLVYKEPESK